MTARPSLHSRFRPLAAVGALALVVGLAGCSDSGSDAQEQSPAPTTSASSAAPSAEASAPAEGGEVSALSQDELEAVFTQIQFVPGQFETTGALLDSVYPGLTVSDESCLAPFGVTWVEETAASDASTEFGTSNDRSMTAVVVSDPDPAIASSVYSDAVDALAACTNGSTLFELAGAPIDMSIEGMEPGISGADEATGWRATGEVGGASFSLVGITAQVGGTAIALVGWDPATNESYVPAATQFFIDAF